MGIEHLEQLYKKYQPTAKVYQPTLMSLQTLAYASLVMAAIDNFMDEDEIALAKGFVTKHWNPAFGDPHIFMNSIDRQVVEFLVPEGRQFDPEEQKKSFFAEVIPSLTGELAGVLYCLIYDVMESDGLQEDRELSLLEEYVIQAGL